MTVAGNTPVGTVPEAKLLAFKVVMPDPLPVMVPPLLTKIFVEIVMLDVKVCAAVQVLVVVNKEDAGEAIQVGAAPGPWLCRICPLDPAPLLTDKAPPDTIRLEEIVTA